MLASLQREYGIRAALKEDWAVLPRALLPYGEGAVLILDDPGGTPLRRLASLPGVPTRFIAMAMSVSTAVGGMHAAGVIHRALMPEHILVNTSDDRSRAHLTGFGFAALLRPEGTGVPDAELEWDATAFAYMAPELGARMNVRIDARADLYSLGCIFYELLVGHPPFDSVDAAACVHSHATSHPHPPHELSPAVPEQISRIVMKLLSKAPGQRYADAGRLLADLRRCDELQRRHGRIKEFTLDAETALQRLQRADRVLGRDRDLETLDASFCAVADDARMHVAWVSGRSGIGKSTLLHTAVGRMRCRGSLLLAAGKSEEARRGTPYAILAQVLEPLLQFVLGREDAEFIVWRDRVKAATSPVGRTLAAFLPGLAVVLGPQPAAPAAPEAALALERERVMQAMARLIACFASTTRPLVLLLDDLQWADVNTLQVLERLLRQHGDVAIFLIGAWRSNEVDADHLLHAGGLAGAPGAVHIELGPLDQFAVCEILADSLQQDATALGPLAELIGNKTGRNPMFVHHLLRGLADDGLLVYESLAATWQWSLERVAAYRGVDDLVELMSRKLEQLPEVTQSMLRLLACLGDRASNGTLAAIAGPIGDEIANDLQPAVDAGYIHREGDDWVFRHDRIRETAYASLPERERASWHLRIARRQLENGFAQTDVFAVATQANLARKLVIGRDERRAFANLNLEAGRKAKVATAHHSALVFFKAALDFLGSDDGDETGLQARLLCGEAEFMAGALEPAEARLATLERVAGDGIFGANLARLRVALYTTLGRFDLALEIGLEFLRKSGVDVPTRPVDADVDHEYGRLRRWIDEHGMAALRHQPIVVDPLQRAITDIFADLVPPALYTNQNLLDLILLRMANLAIEQGHADASADAYPCMSQIFGARYGDYASSRGFGELALHLVDERGLEKYRGRVYMTFGTLVVPWSAPARSGRDFIRRAFDIVTASGDHTFALYCGRNEASGMLFAGEDLDDVRRTVERGLALARDANFRLVINAFMSQATLVTRLQDGQDVDGRETMPVPVEDAPATLVDFAYWVHRLQSALLFDDLADALESHRRADACAGVARSFAETGDLPFYGALALLALPARNAAQDETILRHLAQLEVWADACPENFVARLELVRAEIARVQGLALAAGDAYAAAVTHARRHAFTQVEALAAEFAAGFHLGRGRELEARAYLRHARSAWRRWGAIAKVRQLEARHPGMLEPDGEHQPVTSRLQALDVQAVLRISSALASDIVPSRLVETMMRTALESAGATNGALALLRDGVWQVPARARVVGGAIVVTQEPAAFASDVLPTSIVQAVARTQESLVVEDARESGLVAQDEYVQRRRPRSVLCVPLVRYSTLVGVLYLENDLTTKVFTAAKAAVLEVFGSQAGFALENARLYEALVEQNEQRAQAEERLRAALAELARASRLQAMGELVASIVHEVSQPISAVDTSASAAARWLDRSTPDIGEARAMLVHISQSARRAKGIIQGLRAMARKAEPQFATLDLCEALREAAMLVATPLEELGVTLALNGMNVPCMVRGDRIQLQQVAVNLMMNGAEAMVAVEEGQRHLSVACGLQEGALVIISVEDCGSGIDPAIAERLLEPFFTSKANGMGMGLAISKSIVEAHGGTLLLRPRAVPGVQACFTVPLLTC